MKYYDALVAPVDDGLLYCGMAAEKYASVNSKGVVTGKKAGKGKTVKITVTSVSDPTVKATKKIKIK